MTYDYTFRPWTIQDGRCVLSHWSVWDELAKRDNGARELGIRPIVLLDCDPFAPYDGPIYENSREYNGFVLSSSQWCWHTPTDNLALLKRAEFRPLTFAALRARLFGLIDATPNLDWYVFTRWPENVRSTWINRGTNEFNESQNRPNLAIGVVVDDQPTADARIPALYRLRDLCKELAVRYTGVGPVTLNVNHLLPTTADWRCDISRVEISCEISPEMPANVLENIRAVVEQCEEAGVPCVHSRPADLLEKARER